MQATPRDINLFYLTDQHRERIIFDNGVVFDSLKVHLLKKFFFLTSQVINTSCDCVLLFEFLEQDVLLIVNRRSVITARTLNLNFVGFILSLERDIFFS